MKKWICCFFGIAFLCNSAFGQSSQVLSSLLAGSIKATGLMDSTLVRFFAFDFLQQMTMLCCGVFRSAHRSRA